MRVARHVIQETREGSQSHLIANDGSYGAKTLCRDALHCSSHVNKMPCNLALQDPITCTTSDAPSPKDLTLVASNVDSSTNLARSVQTSRVHAQNLTSSRPNAVRLACSRPKSRMLTSQISHAHIPNLACSHLKSRVLTSQISHVHIKSREFTYPTGPGSSGSRTCSSRPRDAHRSSSCCRVDAVRASRTDVVSVNKNTPQSGRARQAQTMSEPDNVQVRQCLR